jgi:tetratricopeptide (TPR) repeat protein
LSPGKQKYLQLLRESVTHPPNSLEALKTAAEFYRIANDWQACHKLYQTLTKEYPNDIMHWYYRSARAIEAGDIQDHLACSREMLKRFGNEEKDIDVLRLVLKAFFLVPGQWATDELAGIQVVYDRLTALTGKQPQDKQLSPAVALALADYRMGKFEAVLQHLNNAAGATADLTGSSWAQMFVVAGLSRASLGHYEKAAEALRNSDGAFKKDLFPNSVTLTHYNYLAREATRLLEGKTNQTAAPALVP